MTEVTGFHSPQEAHPQGEGEGLVHSPSAHTHREAETAVLGTGPLRDLVLVKAPIRPTAEMAAAANEKADSKGHLRQGPEQVWRDMMGAWVASHQAAVSTDTQPGTSAFASEPNMTPPSADSGVREKVAELIRDAESNIYWSVANGRDFDSEALADDILQALAQPAQDGSTGND